MGVGTRLSAYLAQDNVHLRAPYNKLRCNPTEFDHLDSHLPGE